MALRVVAHPGLPEPRRLLADALVQEIGAAGSEALRADGLDLDGVDETTVFVLVDPWGHRALTGMDVTDQPSLLARTVVVLADHEVGDPARRALLAEAAGVFCVSDRACHLLRSEGLAAHRLVLGFTPSWHQDTAVADRPRRVESRCTASPHRLRTLARCADVIAPGAASVTFDDGHIPIGGAPHPPIVDTLATAEVSLLLQPDPDPLDFDWLRASLAMHNGAVVLAERTSGAPPLVAGQQYLAASARNLPTVLGDALRDPALRGAVTDAADAWLRANPLADSVEEMIAVAAGAPHEPVSIDGSLIVRPAPREFQPAARFDDDTGGAIRRILKEVRLDLFEVKREQRRAELRTGADAGTDVDALEEVWTSTALGSRSPRVSIITALFQHASHIGAAIDSVAASDFDDLEMVIVDDGSTDGSADAVVGAASRHPHLAVRLVRHPVNRGLGPARNTALAQARGDLVFVLDADNLVRPEGIGRLVEALDEAPDAVAAYGLLEQFDVDGPIGLSGIFDWWPERFRGGNYIDAMALFRASDVAALGGYTTDRRLYGWEDYDLWCGLAAAGRSVVRVPDFVARYRVAGTSMVTVSDYSHFAAFAALVERHPGLMGGIVPQD